LIDPEIRGVLLVENIHHHHIKLLPITMAAAYALFDALGIPGQIVIHDEVAELEVHAYYFDSGDIKSVRETGLFCAEIPSKV